MNEEQIKRLIRNDSVGEPDFRVEDLLNYAFMLKSAQFKTRQNSFSGFFGWIFSMKSLGMKAAVASVLLAFVMLKPDIDMNSGAGPVLDSVRVNVLVVDSTFFQTNTGVANDSVF
jgi:hypothetical protein